MEVCCVCPTVIFASFFWFLHFIASAFVVPAGRLADHGEDHAAPAHEPRSEEWVALVDAQQLGLPVEVALGSRHALAPTRQQGQGEWTSVHR